MSLTKVTYSMIQGAPVNVLDFMTPEEIAGCQNASVDVTLAFNKALQYNIPYANVILRDVIVPAGRYLITDTLYIRAGMGLVGEGFTATGLTSNGAIIPQFCKLGYGLINGVEVSDASGLEPSVRNIFFYFANGNGIDTTNQAGWRVEDCWFALSGTGVYAAGADGNVAGCLFEESTTGIQLAGQRIIINDCIFTAPNFGIVVTEPNFLWVSENQITDCKFFTCYYQSIYFYPTTKVKDLTITSCLFASSVIPSQQTDQHYISLSSPATFESLTVVGCHFERCRNSDISLASGSGKVLISGCSFEDTGALTIDANGTVTSWAAVSSIFNGASSELSVDGCTFTRIGANSIYTSGSSVTSNIVGCHNYDCGGSGLASNPTLGARSNFYFTNGSINNFVGNCTTNNTNLFVVGNNNFGTYYATNCISEYDYDVYSNQNSNVSIGCRVYQDAVMNVTNIVGGAKHFTYSAAPVSGTYNQGDIVWNNSPTSPGYIGWVCVASGTPGTWKAFGAIS